MCWRHCRFGLNNSILKHAEQTERARNFGKSWSSLTEFWKLIRVLLYKILKGICEKKSWIKITLYRIILLVLSIQGRRLEHNYEPGSSVETSGAKVVVPDDSPTFSVQ